MKFYVFDRSIVGYKNIIKNKTSQDYLKVENTGESLICTIADGHSSDFFTQSYLGAKFACEGAIYVLKKYINCDINKMTILLKNKTIQQEIYEKWRELTFLDMKEKLPNIFKFNFLKYGTTLLIILINKDYILYMKLGDGNILINENNKINKILPDCKKDIVDSMPQYKSYEKVQYKIQSNKNNITDIVMFSDGFEKSFICYDEMIKDIKNTMNAYKKNVFFRYNLEKNYSNYLEDLSKKKGFDDISIIFVNIL